MYYIDGPGATVDHKFTDGDPAAGVAPTTVTDDFMNDVQQEILNVIAAAGIAPAKNVQDQLLKALRGLGGTGIFTTPPLFDNSKKGATTEFVQRALGNFAAQATVTAPGSVSNTLAGQRINVTGAGTLTLPARATVPTGSKFYFLNNTMNVIPIACQAGDTIVAYSSGALTTFNLPSGSMVIFTAGGAQWVVEEGPASLKYTYEFAATFGINGFFMAPSGVIMQYGTAPGTDANGLTTITLPIAFPNSHLKAVAIYTNASRNPIICQVASLLPTQLQLMASTIANTAAAGAALMWLAFGF